jgi:hypothetical protein
MYFCSNLLLGIEKKIPKVHFRILFIELLELIG